MTTGVRVFRDRYLDSVLQLSGTRAMLGCEGVEWASAAMATAANLEILAEQGFDPAELGGGRANDLFLAARAASDTDVAVALAAGEAALFAPRAGDRQAGQEAAGTMGEALRRQPGTNVAIISVPGAYAAIEAHKALSAGLHVLLFSDNVPLDDEIELKRRAFSLGLLVMGPGAGTAMLGGIGLGFANVVKPGRIGVVAAAGTGAQEAMSLLDQWGAGVSHVIGLGGRDLSGAVGGSMARLAVKALSEDPATDAILLVSKPPDERVACDVVGLAGHKPLVASLIGLEQSFKVPDGVELAGTLEQGVAAVLAAVGLATPVPTLGLLAPVEEACRRVRAERTLVRGLFSGGTLCYESLFVLSRLLGPVYSNTPINKLWGLPAPPDSHVCLDLGEEEYTKGRPHPMIDPEARIELIEHESVDPKAAVILVDVVLGYGAHPDPAGLLAPACHAAMRSGDGPQVVAYVLGTDQDPQVLSEQRQKLEEVGCIVTSTAARASLAAAAIAARQPNLVKDLP
jgi:FdrA protein